MSGYYCSKTSQELRVMRSKKYNELRRIEAKRMGYFDLQRVKVLRQQLVWIDAVIASRIDQLALFE